MTNKYLAAAVVSLSTILAGCVSTENQPKDRCEKPEDFRYRQECCAEFRRLSDVEKRKYYTSGDICEQGGSDKSTPSTPDTEGPSDQPGDNPDNDGNPGDGGGPGDGDTRDDDRGGGPGQTTQLRAVTMKYGIA